MTDLKMFFSSNCLGIGVKPSALLLQQYRANYTTSFDDIKGLAQVAES